MQGAQSLNTGTAMDGKRRRRIIAALQSTPSFNAM